MPLEYLPYGENILKLAISLSQNMDYEWVVDAEVLENSGWDGDPEDPRKLCRFVDQNDVFSHVATVLDDKYVPMLPSRAEDGTGLVKHVKLILDSYEKGKEAYIGVIDDLSEYIRTVKALSDANMAFEDSEIIEEVKLNFSLPKGYTVGRTQTYRVKVDSELYENSSSSSSESS